MTSGTIRISKVWKQELSSPTAKLAIVNVSIVRGLRSRTVIKPPIKAKGGRKTKTLRWLCEEGMKPKTHQREHTHRNMEAGAAAHCVWSQLMETITETTQKVEIVRKSAYDL